MSQNEIQHGAQTLAISDELLRRPSPKALNALDRVDLSQDERKEEFKCAREHWLEGLRSLR